MKRIVLLASLFNLLIGVSAFAQSAVKTKTELPKGWHLQDKEKDGYQGISLDQAYSFLLSKKIKSKTVIVAVIDSGIDTVHEDLKPKLWKNPKEIPGNGKDDDKNGYVDDVYGWNFLGGKDGKNVESDSYEAARIYHQYKSSYDGKTIDTTKMSAVDKNTYAMWVRAQEQLNGKDKPDGNEIIFMRRMFTNISKADSILKQAIGKDVYTGKELGDFSPTETDVKKAKMAIYGLLQRNDALEATNKEFLADFDEYISSEEKKLNAATTPPPAYRDDIVKDKYDDFSDKYYGNPDVMATAKGAMHGTHVSGIIGAVRGNGLGIDGVADNVKIMMLRAVPDGDEHDKDIALAIRYAVDNGASIINMSFGKSFSPEKKWVDDAVKYAESKGVLLVHAAGNDAKNLDSSYNFPSPLPLVGNAPNNWITVGASGDPNIGGLTASFSNYGKAGVDVFSPGVKIYSTVPGGNTYQFLQGTSMASPVVAGLAALLLEYFPDLSAKQLKWVIENSASVQSDKVKVPGQDREVLLNEISRTGGVINAYEAVKLAATLKGERKSVSSPKAPIAPKPAAPKQLKGF